MAVRQERDCVAISLDFSLQCIINEINQKSRIGCIDEIFSMLG